jgi:hypothetical protein
MRAPDPKYVPFLLHPIFIGLLIGSAALLWVFSVVPVLLIGAVVVGAATSGAYAIRETVRWFNRRDDPRHVTRRPDVPPR